MTLYADVVNSMFDVAVRSGSPCVFGILALHHGVGGNHVGGK